MSSIGQAVAHSSREGYGGSNTHFHSMYPIYSFPSWSRGPSSSAVVQLSSSPELDLSKGSQVSSEFKTVHTQEKNLQELTALLLLCQRHSEPLCLQALYEQEVKELHATVDQTCSERQAAQEQSCYEEEIVQMTEVQVADARKKADEVGMACAKLGKRAQNLLMFLKRFHDREIREEKAMKVGRKRERSLNLKKLRRDGVMEKNKRMMMFDKMIR
uniref:Uncharacterized protein n=1 Tax=Pygocentrus nattereri TaxID=42514 RepID=A0A3B4BZK9_PYGNA